MRGSCASSEIGVPLPSADSPPLEPTADDIERLKEAAPRYGLTLLPPAVDPKNLVACDF